MTPRFSRSATVTCSIGWDLATGRASRPAGVAGQAIIFARATPTEPMMVTCGGGKLTALDPTGTPRPVEHATIEGTVTCTGCDKHSGLPRSVTVADKSFPVSGGRFKGERSRPRGWIHIESNPEHWGSRKGHTLTDGGESIELTGAHTYHTRCELKLENP